VARMANAASHLTDTSVDRKTVKSSATAAIERSGGRHPGMLTRCASRLLELPMLRRLKFNRRLAARMTSARSDDDEDADVSDSAAGRRRGRKLFTSTSLPERINRQSSVAAIVANRKPIDRESSDSDVYSHQLSHDFQQRLQLDVSADVFRRMRGHIQSRLMHRATTNLIVARFTCSRLPTPARPTIEFTTDV
jgi:hypothetical protein